MPHVLLIGLLLWFAIGIAIAAVVVFTWWVMSGNKPNPSAMGMCTIPGQAAPVHCSYSDCQRQGGTDFAPDDGSQHINPQTDQPATGTQQPGGQGGGP